MEEIWKYIKGYEGLYQVSNLGRVKMLPRLKWNGYGIHILKERIKKDFLSKQGYHYVHLSRDGKEKNFLVHRIVYEAFKGEIQEGYEVNHLDECKDNNSINNLNLMTHIENINWATGIERGHINRRKKIIMDEEIEFDSMKKAADYLGCSPSNVSQCCRNKVHTVYGHKFRYK